MSFIPGMAGVVDSAGELIPPVEFITVTAYTSEASTIAWPVDRLVGDVAVLFQNSMNFGGAVEIPAEVIPTGFTKLAGETDFFTAGAVVSHRSVEAYKILDGSESGNLAGMNGATDMKHLLIVRATGTIIRNVGHSTWLAGWGSNPAAQVLDTDAGDFPKLACGHVAGVDRNFSMAPGFDAQSSLFQDMGGGTLWRSRAGYSIFNPGDTLVDYLVDSNGRAVLTSGLLWFS